MNTIMGFDVLSLICGFCLGVIIGWFLLGGKQNDYY